MSGTTGLDGLGGVVLGASPFCFVARLQRQVREKGACSLPGVSIDYNRFMVIMWRAVSLGWVSHSNAEFVAHGLWHGFDCGLDVNPSDAVILSMFAPPPRAPVSPSDTRDGLGLTVVAYSTTLSLNFFSVSPKISTGGLTNMAKSHYPPAFRQTRESRRK